MLPPLQPPIELGTLPPPINALLDNVTSILTVNFPQYPPHTVQRLSEIVLHPKQHYRSLTAYLHALDRLVHVTSGANTYPLPPAIPDISDMTRLANGAGASGQAGLMTTSAANNVGSDEALGGALLTPIPWLTRRANGDEDGTGSESGGSSSPLSAQGHGQGQDQGQPPQHRSSHSQQSGPGGRPLEGQVRTEHTETIDGPNGVGSIETVSVSVNGIPSTGAGGGGAVLVSRGVTQGELLRQEQRAGVVPVSQLSRHGHGAGPPHAGGGANGGMGVSDAPGSPPTAAADEDAPMPDEHEMIPHARGPEEIGAADTGPQQETTSSYVTGGAGGVGGVDMHGIDVERAVGRRSDHPTAGGGGEQQQQQQQRGGGSSSSSPEGEAVVPRSPKREAEEDIDGGASKRIREDDDGAAAAAAVAGDGDGDVAPPKRDAEGDVVIADSAEAAPEAEAAGGGGAEPGSEAETAPPAADDGAKDGVTG